MRHPNRRLALLLALYHFQALLASAFALNVNVKPPPIPPSVFPLSTRQILIQKSQEITETAGYTTAGFSNRKGLVLTPLAPPSDPATGVDAVYGADRPFLWNKIDVMGRMAVIALPSSSPGDLPDLWVHSPVPLDGPLQKAIDSIGDVKHIVAPNYEHVKYAGAWKRAYPDAEVWACPGMAVKEPSVPWSGEFAQGYRPKDFQSRRKQFDVTSTTTRANTKMWDSSIIETLHVDIEINPFTRKPFFNECIFYHKPSKSLIATDLFWNYPDASGVPNAQFGRDDSWELAPAVSKIPLGSQLWKLGMDKVYLPFFDNCMVQDKDEYQAIVRHIVDVWDVETVIPAHGDVLRGKELVRKYLSDFLGYRQGEKQ
jgi:hypothetical protein